jgi:CRAL/TRIO domain
MFESNSDGVPSLLDLVAAERMDLPRPSTSSPQIGSLTRRGTRSVVFTNDESMPETESKAERSDFPVPERDHAMSDALYAELFPRERLALALLRERLEQLGVSEWRDPSSPSSSESESESGEEDTVGKGKKRETRDTKEAKKRSKKARAQRRKQRALEHPILLPFDPLEDLVVDIDIDLNDDGDGGDEAMGEHRSSQQIWASERLDRFLCGCLFARKFDLDRVVRMLELNTAWRREWDCHRGWPTFESVRETSSSLDMLFFAPGARGRHGGGVMYLELRKFVPQDAKFTVADWMRYNQWFASQGSLLNELDGHRNGVVIVEDLSGVKLKNLGIGTEFSGKEAQKMQNSVIDCFPMRIHKLLILNAPVFLKMMLRLARSMGVKKKILKRVQVLQSEDQLSEFVDRGDLARQFGGDLECDHDRMHDALVRWNSEWNPTM